MKRLMVYLAAAGLLATAAAAQDNGVTATAYGTVNVRSGPGAQYEIVGRLAAGDRVPVDGRDRDGGWLRVVLAVEELGFGWVASFAVLVEGDIFQLPITGDDFAAGVGEPVTITAYGLVNVRSGPGMDYPITGQLDAGDVLPVIGRSGADNNWLYIQDEEVEGWVAYFTVTLQGDPNALPLVTMDGNGLAVVPGNYVIKTRFNVRLRAAASSGAETLGVIPFGRSVTPLARTEDGGWLYVIYQELTGWGLRRLFEISDRQIEMLPVYEPPATPSPTGTP
jgi:uncharacterized protein YraI